MALITCKECQHKVSDSAEKCPSCGAKVPQKTSAFTWVVVAVIAFWVISSVTGSRNKEVSAGNDSEVSAAPESMIAVKGSEIAAAYDQNEARADAIFKGKVIKLTGIIAGIDKDVVDNTVIQIRGLNEFQHVHATLAEGEAKKALNLRKGQKIVMKCIGGGEIIGSPMLDKCEILQ